MLPNSEWILLAILAVILLKPDDIPNIAKLIGKLVRYANNLWGELIALDKETRPLKAKNPFHCAPPKARIQALKD